MWRADYLSYMTSTGSALTQRSLWISEMAPSKTLVLKPLVLQTFLRAGGTNFFDLPAGLFLMRVWQVISFHSSKIHLYASNSMPRPNHWFSFYHVHRRPDLTTSHIIVSCNMGADEVFSKDMYKNVSSSPQKNNLKKHSLEDGCLAGGWFLTSTGFPLTSGCQKWTPARHIFSSC